MNAVLQALKQRFDTLLNGLNGASVTQFSSTVESGYEALVVATVMSEYTALHGTIQTVTPPATGSFLSQSPSRFLASRAFRIDFTSGRSFYFAADVEVFGLAAQPASLAFNTRFEADVVVIEATHEPDIRTNCNNYPMPHHLLTVVECKHGAFHKSQLRELLGLRRHISMLGGIQVPASAPGCCGFGHPYVNASPPIGVFLARPQSQPFLDLDTAAFYDVKQVVV